MVGVGQLSGRGWRSPLVELKGRGRTAGRAQKVRAGQLVELKGGGGGEQDSW